MVNKFFYKKGGSETYYFALKHLLEQKGHTVIDFSMTDEKNFESEYSQYFVKNIDYNEKNNIFYKLKAANNIVYSFEAKRKFRELIEKTKPDIIHLHIFQHQISPSILDVIKKYDIPTVYTAHDLKMLCLNYKMMHHGKICEQCKKGKYYHCAINKCVKDSFFKSCINVVEGYFHKWIKSYNAIDVIVTPSNFYKRKFIEFGVSQGKVCHIPNFLDKETTYSITNEKERYYLYLGRLSAEKGIFTMLDAFAKSKKQLYIAGTGPIEEKIKKKIKTESLDNIKMLGFKTGQELVDLIGNAKAIIIPSEWYENGPYSAIEALQLGVPIIGADIGGIPELVKDNGFLFKSGDSQALINAINNMEALTIEEYQKFKNVSKDLFHKYYTSDFHYELLQKVYNSAIKLKNI